MTDYWIVFSKKWSLETFRAGWMHPWKYIMKNMENISLLISRINIVLSVIFIPPPVKLKFFLRT